jgi:hypothetical protein
MKGRRASNLWMHSHRSVVEEAAPVPTQEEQYERNLEDTEEKEIPKFSTRDVWRVGVQYLYVGCALKFEVEVADGGKVEDGLE